MTTTAPQPYQIRLIVGRDGDGYAARWIEQDGQTSAPFPLTLPLTEERAADLRWYLETYVQFPGAGDHARAAGIEARFKEWGQALFDALFGSAEGTHVYRTLLDAAAKRRNCLLTIGASESQILIQPWEMMRDKRGPLALQGITIRRQLQGSGRPRQDADGVLLRERLRMLLIVSRPSDVGFIDPRNSIAPMLDVLDDLPGQVTLEFCDPPTLARLEQMIAQAHKENEPYQIVHFDGHGTYLPHTGIGALAFEADDATHQLVTGTQLGDLLARMEVPLVLLEACRSADLSNQPVFGSVAPALLESGVGSVVAFSHSVHVHAARLLVERFYRELAGGRTIGQALQEARAALRANPNRWLHRGPDAETVALQDWFIPQLYQVGDDPTLIKSRPKKRTKAAPPSPARPLAPAPLHGFPPEPMYHFHGRAQELLALERAFRRHPALLLSGMGGMGKTALSREAAAWWLRAGRFEAAVFCSFEQQAGAERVVQLLGQALEGDQFGARPAEAQWAAAVDLFRRRRVLLVWDNFESTLPIFGPHPLAPSPTAAGAGEQGESSLSFGAAARAELLRLYRDLTAGAPQGRLLITCRPDETGLPALKELELGGLARPDSLHMLAAALDLKDIAIDRPGQEREGYERAEIEALLDMLDDHPLSIELVTPHLKTLTPRRIRDEFGQLLESFAEAGAYEGRNRSLLASLEFSKRRLSPAALAALPYLAWFAGGVFEDNLLHFTELAPEAWDAIRVELVATALVKVEDDWQFNKRPYLRFHPTLPYAARAADVPDADAAEQRFIAVYVVVCDAADGMLFGSLPANGMALLAREEANLRAASARAFRHSDRQAGQRIVNTLSEYLQRAGRLRELDALVTWARDQVTADGGLDEAACAAIRQHAWGRFTQGQAGEAIETLAALIAQLEAEGLAGGADAVFQIALSYLYLGRVYYNAGRPDLALAPLQASVERFEQLTGDYARGNLSAALGDLANSYLALGQHGAALQASERGLAVRRELGNNREIAAGLGRSAAILVEQQRYAEADARYAEALDAARATGDLGLQGLTFQHQGTLQAKLGNYDRADELYRQALALFQRAGDLGEEMRTCNNLANVESGRGQLDAAAAWYARSRELALKLNDRAQLAIVAQNAGILAQTRAERAADPAARAALLREAIASVAESLAIKLELHNQVGTAQSYSQLGILHRMLGELEQAEVYARQGMEIDEALGLPDVYMDYANLAAIARDHGDAEAADRWQAKHDAKLAELEQLRRGDGAVGPSAEQVRQIREYVLALAEAAYAARTSRSPLPPDAAEALAQLAQAPPPLGAVAPFLKAIADGQPAPPLPVGLPAPVVEVLEALVKGLAG
jgi:hypothetical protein